MWADFNAEHLIGKIGKMLGATSYAENMKTVSKLFHDQKEEPLDRAIWWIEWTIRHPNSTHLRSLGHELNFIQLQSIDVLAVILFVTSAIVWLSLKMLRLIFSVLGRLIIIERRRIKNKNE